MHRLDADRVMGADAARAVGRFKPQTDGYRAASAPDAPLRTTRTAAVEDERTWLERHGTLDQEGRPHGF